MSSFDNKEQCDSCGGYFHERSMTFEDSAMCVTCRDESTVWCDYCEEQVPADETHITEGIPPMEICNRCALAFTDRVAGLGANGNDRVSHPRAVKLEPFFPELEVYHSGGRNFHLTLKNEDTDWLINKAVKVGAHYQPLGLPTGTQDWCMFGCGSLFFYNTLADGIQTIMLLMDKGERHDESF